MNRKTRKRKKIKKYMKTKNKKYIKKNYKNKTKKKAKNRKQLGGSSKTCKKKDIEKKYKIVFVKNQTGGGKDEKKIEITPEFCKNKIRDLETQYNKYLEEWKNFN